MPGLWKGIVKLNFKGKRFEDHALDRSALEEICQYLKIVTETAKELWKAEHTDRERLPKNFEESTRLCLRNIAVGSTVAELGTYVEPSLFEKELEPLKKSVETTKKVFESQEREEPLPIVLSQDLLDEYTKLGEGLSDDESIELSPAWMPQKPAHVTRKTSERLARFKEEKYEDQVDVIGEVLEADVRNGHFQLWPDEKAPVKVSFSPEQEDLVTDALKNHRSIRLQVKGRGKFSPQGKLESVEEVSELNLQAVGEIQYDETARPIEEILMELAKEVPMEEWEKLPKDLSENLDRYIYGTPKE